MRREGAVGVYVVVTIVAFAVLLPAIYVLSVGPAVRLAHHEFVSQEAIETAYIPLIYLMDNWEPAQTVLSAYVELWEPPMVSVAAPLPMPPNGAPLPP